MGNSRDFDAIKTQPKVKIRFVLSSMLKNTLTSSACHFPNRVQTLLFDKHVKIVSPRAVEPRA